MRPGFQTQETEGVGATPRGVHPSQQRDASGLWDARKRLRPAPLRQRSRHLHREGSPNTAAGAGVTRFF